MFGTAFDKNTPKKTKSIVTPASLLVSYRVMLVRVRLESYTRVILDRKILDKKLFICDPTKT
jgi:hypothetical protein